jgi:two-component system chemotaxis response regulator CheY
MSYLETKILVAVDYLPIRTIIVNLLYQIGFKNIDDVANGLQALNKIKNGGYGLVIADWKMPNMTGIELLKNIRGNPSLKDMMFIMITVESEREHVLESKELGVDEYLVKPFTTNAFIEKLSGVFYRRRSIHINDPYRSSTKTKRYRSISQKASAHTTIAPPPCLMAKGIKDKNSAAAKPLSSLFGPMKASDGFISVADLMRITNETIKEAEKQTIQAAKISSATSALSRSIMETTKNSGSPDKASIGRLNESSTEICAMLEEFSEKTSQINNNLAMIQELATHANLHTMNKSIEASTDMEISGSLSSAMDESKIIADLIKEVSDILAKINSESAGTNNTIIEASEKITHAMAEAAGSGDFSQDISEPLQNILGSLRWAADALKEQTAISSNSTDMINRTIAAADTVTEASLYAISNDKTSVETGRKTAIMIDLLKTNHTLCIHKLGEHLKGHADFHPSHLPGRESCMLGKWLDNEGKKLAGDSNIYKQICTLRKDIHELTSKTLETFGADREAALRIYNKIMIDSDIMLSYLEEIKDSLR